MNKVAKELLGVAKEILAISQPTQEQMKRVKAELKDVAREDVTVEWVNGLLYAFVDSELGMYRIWDYYHAKPRKGFSNNLRKWFVNVVE